ncbi:PspC domain-containing protein [Cellulomonas sp. NPDC089187]|uniref:PspC domain-containing protein n=1 Tax=Cellulomonas sp. NPDC089187 TaxID=3154970 RepID=UPI003443194C
MTNDSTGYGPGTPPPAGSGPTPGAPGGRSGDGFFGAIRKVGVTRGQDRWIGGVASGLAQRFGMDPLLMRGLVGLSVLLGFGLVLYGIAWALLPEPDGRIHLEQAIHGDWDGGLIGAGVLVLVGATNGGWWFSWGPFDSGWFSVIAWSAAVVAVIVILANARRDRRDSTSTEGPVPMTEPTPAASPASSVTPTAGPTGNPPIRTSATVPPAAPVYGSAPVTPTGVHPPISPSPLPGGPGTPLPPRPVPPHTGGPSWQSQPPKPPKPPKPVKPPVPGPGSAMTGAVMGLILIGLAGLLIADRTGHYDGPVASIVVGGGIVLVGLGIILCGLLGRRSGGLTALAIIGIVLAGPAVAADSDTWWDSDRRTAGIGDERYLVESRSAAEAGFALGMGSAVVDLTEVPLVEDEALEVPVQVGIGDITVIVPNDTPVRATVRSGGGQVFWTVDDRDQELSGVANRRVFTSDEVSSDTPAQLDLRADIGLGNITIEEN